MVGTEGYISDDTYMGYLYYLSVILFLSFSALVSNSRYNAAFIMTLSFVTHCRLPMPMGLLFTSCERIISFPSELPLAYYKLCLR